MPACWEAWDKANLSASPDLKQVREQEVDVHSARRLAAFALRSLAVFLLFASYFFDSKPTAPSASPGALQRRDRHLSGQTDHSMPIGQASARSLKACSDSRAYGRPPSAPYASTCLVPSGSGDRCRYDFSTEALHHHEARNSRRQPERTRRQAWVCPHFTLTTPFERSNCLAKTGYGKLVVALDREHPRW